MSSNKNGLWIRECGDHYEVLMGLTKDPVWIKAETFNEAVKIRDNTILKSNATNTGYADISINTYRKRLEVHVRYNKMLGGKYKQFRVGKRTFKECLREAISYRCDLLDIYMTDDVDYTKAIRTYNSLVKHINYSDLKLFKVGKCDIMAFCDISDIPTTIATNASSVKEIGRAMAGSRYGEVY